MSLIVSSVKNKKAALEKLGDIEKDFALLRDKYINTALPRREHS